MKDEIAHQGHGYDCGCHVIWNMIQFVGGVDSYNKMPQDFRKIVALWILSQDHSLVFPNFKPLVPEVIEILI